MSKLSKLIFYTGILFIICGVFSFLNNDIPTKKVETKKVEAKETKKEYIKISAEELSEAYLANEVSADSKYLNKNLEITGIVDDISVVLGHTYINLKGTDKSLIHNIQVSTTKAKAMMVKKGQQIIVRGKCDGYGISIEIKEDP